MSEFVYQLHKAPNPLQAASSRILRAPRGLKRPRPGPSPRYRDPLETDDRNGRGPEPRKDRVSAHPGYGPMAQTVTPTILRSRTTRWAKTGLTKRQVVMSASWSHPLAGRGARAAPGGRHNDQAAVHSEGMFFW